MRRRPRHRRRPQAGRARDRARARRSSSTTVRSAWPRSPSRPAPTCTRTTSRAAISRRTRSRSRTMLQGYLRADGRKGIRNVLVVAYLVECAHHVAREIAAPFRDRGVHLIGFPGCYPNAYALRDDGKAVHASQRRRRAAGVARLRGLQQAAAGEGRRGVGPAGAARSGSRTPAAPARRSPPAANGSSARSPTLAAHAPVAMRADELVVGTICGGSDATSGLTANPAMGVAFDLLVADGAAAIFEETGELIGMEHLMAARAANAALGEELKRTVAKAADVLRDAGLCELRARQRRRRAHDHRGEVARRLRQVRAIADRRHHQAGHRAAAQGALPARRRARRRSALRLPQHQRQRRDRRADRLRLARDPVLDRARLRRRVGHRARDQGVRQSRDLAAHERRHGRRRRPHPRRARHAAGRSAARSTT